MGIITTIINICTYTVAAIATSLCSSASCSAAAASDDGLSQPTTEAAVSYTHLTLPTNREV